MIYQIRKDKLKAKLIREMKNTKYREREQIASVQSHRVRTLLSERASPYDFEPPKDFETFGDMASKEDIKSSNLFRIKEVLTKPINTNIGMLLDYKTHLKRLNGLKKKNATFCVERVNSENYSHL